jgi:hypothetical protein
VIEATCDDQRHQRNHSARRSSTIEQERTQNQRSITRLHLPLACNSYASTSCVSGISSNVLMNCTIELDHCHDTSAIAHVSFSKAFTSDTLNRLFVHFSGTVVALQLVVQFNCVVDVS